jgi:hypothetical protein
LIEKLGQNYRFSKTPRSYRNLILGEAWNNFDGKNGRKSMFLKTPCSQKSLVLDVSWNNLDGKIGRQIPVFFQTPKNHLRFFLIFLMRKPWGKQSFFSIPFVRQNSQLKSVLEQF